MRLKLRYFGQIAEAIGSAEESIQLDTTISVLELKEKLSEKYTGLDQFNYKIAINQTVETEDFLIDSDSEIALLPPFAGG